MPSAEDVHANLTAMLVNADDEKVQIFHHSVYSYLPHRVKKHLTELILD